MPAGGQQTLQTADGRVDVVGLRQWNLAMLADSIQHYAPGVSLFQTVECTKALSGQLKFPGVYFLKTIVGQQGDRAESVLLFLVEHEDAGRIKWRKEPGKAAPDAARWKRLQRTVVDSGAARWSEGDIVNPLQYYPLYRKRGAAAALERAAFAVSDSAQAMRFWQVLEQQNQPADKALALATLRSDANRQHRMFAAAVLTNFDRDDDAWHALVGALRDPYTGVNHTAILALSGLMREYPRPVAWRHALPSLRAVLDGTNLEAFTLLLQLLTRTAIDPALAVPLMKGRSTLVVELAGVNDRRSRQIAVDFLRAISRQPDTTSWRTWLAGL